MSLHSGKRQSIWLGLEKDKVDIEARTITFRLLKKRSVQIVTQSLTQREHEIVHTAYAESPAECPFIFTTESERNFEHGAIRGLFASQVQVSDLAPLLYQNAEARSPRQTALYGQPPHLT